MCSVYPVLNQIDERRNFQQYSAGSILLLIPKTSLNFVSFSLFTKVFKVEDGSTQKEDRYRYKIDQIACVQNTTAHTFEMVIHSQFFHKRRLQYLGQLVK